MRKNRPSVARIRRASIDTDTLLVWAQAEHTFAGLAFLEEGAVFEFGVGGGGRRGEARRGEGEGKEEGVEDFHGGG